MLEGSIWVVLEVGLFVLVGERFRVWLTGVWIWCEGRLWSSWRTKQVGGFVDEWCWEERTRRRGRSERRVVMRCAVRCNFVVAFRFISCCGS